MFGLSTWKYNFEYCNLILLKQGPYNVSGLVWAGDIKKVVGEILPCSNLNVNLDVLPIKSGVWVGGCFFVI